MKNEKEFTTLAETYMDMIYRIALHVVQRPEDAEDVTQNVLLRLYRSGPEFDSTDHARHWLVRVTGNEAKRLVTLPHRKRETGMEDMAAEIAAESFPGADSLHRELFQAVMDLPVKYRLPMYLYYYEGYAVREIAEITGSRLSTVQTRLARGREKLKHVLGEEWK